MTATVLSGPERRRRWTRAEKLRLIEETLAPEATVAEVARRYDVHPNLLHSWRRQTQQGVLTGGAGASPAPADATGFAAVAIEPPVPSLSASGRTAAGSRRCQYGGSCSFGNGACLRDRDKVQPTRFVRMEDDTTQSQDGHLSANQ